MKIVGQENIAEIFGVAPKTIIAWQEAGMPILKRGQPGIASEFDSAECIRWYAEFQLARANADRPRDRLNRAQAELAEINLAVRRGELASVTELSRLMRAGILNAREFLRSEGPRLALLLEGLDRAQRTALIVRTFDEFLSKLAAWRPTSPDA